MNFEDNVVNVENVEGDLTAFLIYDKFLEKLDGKISPEKCRKVKGEFLFIREIINSKFFIENYFFFNKIFNFLLKINFFY